MEESRSGPKRAEPVKRNDEQKLIAALSYLGILFIVPLLYPRKDSEIRWHLRQGIVLFCADLIVMLIAWIPLFGWALALLALIVSVYGFLQAWQGNRWEIPFLYQYAQKINL